VTGDIEATRDGRDIDAYGCGLSHTIAKAPEGETIRHLGQSDDALHADHVGRQGTGPVAVCFSHEKSMCGRLPPESVKR
jgi:hypothetical protein